MNLYQFVRTPRDGVLGICKYKDTSFRYFHYRQQNNAFQVSESISRFWPSHFVCSLFVNFVDSHPLFRRGYEILCKDIKRPSKSQYAVSARKQEEELQGRIAHGALLTHIVPLERNSNTSNSFRRVVTDNDLNATRSNASQSSMSISHRSNERCNDYQEQTEGKKPFQMVITTTTTSSNTLEFDPFVMRSSEFNLRDGFQRNPSLFHLHQEDDDCSMGTIDDFSNFHAIGWRIKRTFSWRWLGGTYFTEGFTTRQHI